MPQLRIDHILPGGVLPGDRWFDLKHDGTCSRCGKAIGEDEVPLQLWDGKDRLLAFCETCVKGPHHDNDNHLCAARGDHGAEPLVRGRDGHGAAAEPTDRDAGVAAEGVRAAPMTEDTRKYLVWSNEHRLWWGPGHSGYTPIISQAGRYGVGAALMICTNANAYLKATAEPNEVMVLAPEELSAAQVVANSPGLTEDTEPMKGTPQ